PLPLISGRIAKIPSCAGALDGQSGAFVRCTKKHPRGVFHDWSSTCDPWAPCRRVQGSARTRHGPAKANRSGHDRLGRRLPYVSKRHHRSGQSRRQWRWRGHRYRHVRRHPVQSRDLLHEPHEGGSARRHQSSDAGQTCKSSRRAFASRRHRDGPGSRPQIRHHRQPGSRRQMSDDAASPDNETGPSVPASAISRELPIINKRGLHARASAKFVQTVERFNAEVWVTKGGETVGGTSIMGLMMLSAGPGTSITVSAIGPEAEAAVAAISELVASKFNEEGT